MKLIPLTIAVSICALFPMAYTWNTINHNNGNIATVVALLLPMIFSSLIVGGIKDRANHLNRTPKGIMYASYYGGWLASGITVFSGTLLITLSVLHNPDALRAEGMLSYLILAIFSWIAFFIGILFGAIVGGIKKKRQSNKSSMDASVNRSE